MSLIVLIITIGIIICVIIAVISSPKSNDIETLEQNRISESNHFKESKTVKTDHKPSEIKDPQQLHQSQNRPLLHDSDISEIKNYLNSIRISTSTIAWIIGVVLIINIIGLIILAAL